jgi:hypothetical protein
VRLRHDVVEGSHRIAVQSLEMVRPKRIELMRL